MVQSIANTKILTYKILTYVKKKNKQIESNIQFCNSLDLKLDFVGI